MRSRSVAHQWRGWDNSEAMILRRQWKTSRVLVVFYEPLDGSFDVRDWPGMFSGPVPNVLVKFEGDLRT